MKEYYVRARIVKETIGVYKACGHSLQDAINTLADEHGDDFIEVVDSSEYYLK